MQSKTKRGRGDHSMSLVSKYELKFLEKGRRKISFHAPFANFLTECFQLQGMIHFLMHRQQWCWKNGFVLFSTTFTLRAGMLCKEGGPTAEPQPNKTNHNSICNWQFRDTITLWKECQTQITVLNVWQEFLLHYCVLTSEGLDCLEL